MLGAEDLGSDDGGEEGVVGRDRLIQAPMRWIGVVGVWMEGVVGVMGLEVRGLMCGRVGGDRVSLADRNLLDAGEGADVADVAL